MGLENSPIHQEYSKYQLLHDRGVVLADKEIDFIIQQIMLGMRDVYDHFQIPFDKRTLGFMASDNLDRIGYAVEQNAVNLPIAYLNKQAQKTGPLQDSFITLGFRQMRSVPYPRYLRNAGREETIHWLQKQRHNALTVYTPGDRYMIASEVERLLCDLEVEARRMVDVVAVLHGEEPLWREVDFELQQMFPEQYNTPIDTMVLPSNYASL